MTVWDYCTVLAKYIMLFSNYSTRIQSTVTNISTKYHTVLKILYHNWGCVIGGQFPSTIHFTNFTCIHVCPCQPQQQPPLLVGSNSSFNCTLLLLLGFGLHELLPWNKWKHYTIFNFPIYLSCFLLLPLCLHVTNFCIPEGLTITKLSCDYYTFSAITIITKCCTILLLLLLSRPWDQSICYSQLASPFLLLRCWRLLEHLPKKPKKRYSIHHKSLR